MALGFARVDHGAHGALQLHDSSRAVLRGERAVQLRSDVRVKGAARKGTRRRAGAPAAAIDPESLGERDAALLARLKAWRAGEAKAQSVPAYVVMNDVTLIEIARRRPADRDGLAGITGIGARRLERYGEGLLEVVRDAR